MWHHLRAAVAALACVLAIARPGAGHDDELRDVPPPVRAEFVPPAPGTYTLHTIMRAPRGTVLDTLGRARPLSEFTTGKITLLSLVYTSCSDAWGCPLAYRVLDGVGAAVERSPALRSRVRLVTLSFDPDRDSPATMRRYAGARAASQVEWQFLTTASDRALSPILDGFGQDTRVQPDDGSGQGPTLGHVLKVFLIDPRGGVREIYTTAYLYPEVVLADIETLRLESLGRRAVAR